VYTGVQGPCTYWCVHGRTQGTPTRSCTLYTAVFTARVHGCHGRVQTVYTAVHGPRTCSVRDPITTVDAARTRPCTENTAVFTARVHGIVRTVYTAVHGEYGSCTPACKGRVHGASTAVYRVHLHGRVFCTRPCLRPVYTAAHGRVQTVYTAVHGPRTWSVRHPITACTDRVHRRARAVYMVLPRPCTGYTYTVVYPVHGRVYGPRTRPLNGRVHGPYTAVNGRVGGQRRCTRVVNTPVYMTAVYGRAVIRPCARVMDAPCT